MVGRSRETPGGPDAFGCGVVPEVWTPLRASTLNPDLVMGGISLAGSQQEKTLESPLDGKEKKPVNPKGNQS